MPIRLLLGSIVLLVSIIFGQCAGAQTEEPQRPLALAEKDWALTFSAVDSYIRSEDKTAVRQRTYVSALRDIIAEATLFHAEAETNQTAQQRLLDALGPPPAEGQPPEAREVAQQRRDLTNAVTAYRARQSQADLALARAKALQAQLSEAFRADFLTRLLARQPAPLSPTVFTTGFSDVGAKLGTLLSAPIDWYRGLSEEQRQRFWFGWRTIAIFGAALAAWPVRRLLLRRLGPNTAIEKPSYTRRFGAAIAVAVADGLMPSVLLAAVYFRIKTDLDLQAGLAADVITHFSIALILLVVTAALANAALAPGHPNWRLTRLTARSARRLFRTIVLLATVYVLDRAIAKSVTSLAPGPEAQAVWSLLVGGIEASGLVLLTRSSLWKSEPIPGQSAEAEKAEVASPAPSHAAKVFRRAVAVAAIGSVIATAAGYVALGHQILQGLLSSATVLAAVYLVKRLAEEFIAVVSSLHIRDGRLTLDNEAHPNLSFWLAGVVTLLIYGLASYALLLIWGVPGEDIDRWLAAAVEGFAIGGVTISFADIGKAIVVFAVGLFLTSRLRRLLDQRILPRTNVDAGVRNSLATGAGYVGAVVSALIAVAVIGVNLSNLAIVAGALSVGIGFGLQNIVNNFVSGLILLIERPIKVGDWVVVGSQQGFVKHISVRATEILTFDRSSVILPNSELLSTAVVNWTYKDKLGRVEIRVGVAYGSDAEKVREILLACADAHPEVVSWPQPFVIFADFGASSLDFILYAYLRDVEKRLRTASDLRFAINKAFATAGIEIPFSQHDIHLRDLDRLLDALPNRGQVASMPATPPPVAAGGAPAASAPVAPPAEPLPRATPVPTPRLPRDSI
jgi:potassium efflux system protein